MNTKGFFEYRIRCVIVSLAGEKKKDSKNYFNFMTQKTR